MQQAVTKGQRLFKSTSIVAAMTMISRLLGFVRDVVFAQLFGAGAAFDAFVIAFKIPNFFRRLFAEGAFSQAFVPILAEFRTKRPEEDVRDFVNRIAGSLGFSVMVLVLLAELIAPVIILIFAPGFGHHSLRAQLATHMLRITFPYILLISLSALMGAILNTCGRFAIPAFTPVLLNIALVTVAWFWAPHMAHPIFALAWGVLIGGVCQIAIQIPALKKLGLLPIPKIGFHDPGVRRVMKLMVPALFGVSVAQLSLLIDNFFASFLPTGSISWLYYSDRLTYLPLGVIGVALATVVMPHLSRHHSRDSQEIFSATLDWALRCVVLVGVPAAIGLFVLAGPLLATLFHGRAFTDYDVVMTSKSLMAFALGLPAFMLIKVLASAFYSRQNIKTPVKIAAVAVVVNLIFNLALIVPLRHAGLALSTSIAAFFNAVFLLLLLLQKNIYKPMPEWRIFLLRTLLANIALAVTIILLSGKLQRWLRWHILESSGHLLLIIVVGVLVYLIVLFVMGMRIKHLRPPVEEVSCN